MLRRDAQFLGDVAAELRRRHRLGGADGHGVGQALDLQVPRGARGVPRGAARGGGAGCRSGDWGIHLGEHNGTRARPEVWQLRWLSMLSMLSVLSVLSVLSMLSAVLRTLCI